MGSLPVLCVNYLLFFFSLGCVYLCSHLPRTFAAAWVPILDFYLQGFSCFLIKHVTTPWNKLGSEDSCTT
jgi:hypothetical protein